GRHSADQGAEPARGPRARLMDRVTRGVSGETRSADSAQAHRSGSGRGTRPASQGGAAERDTSRSAAGRHPGETLARSKERSKHMAQGAAHGPRHPRRQRGGSFGRQRRGSPLGPKARNTRASPREAVGGEHGADAQEGSLGGDTPAVQGAQQARGSGGGSWTEAPRRQRGGSPGWLICGREKYTREYSERTARSTCRETRGVHSSVRGRTHPSAA